MLSGFNLLDGFAGNPQGISQERMAAERGSEFVNDFMSLNSYHLRRPFFDDHMKPCVLANTGRWTVEKGERKPILQRYRVADLVNNHGIFDPIFLTANAQSLRKEQWQEMDEKVLLAYRGRLRAWADLAGANTYGGFNGMGRMTLEYEAMSDPGEALVDMDGMTEERADSPLFRIRSLPLPITHAGFWFSQRRLDISRNGGQPLDTTMAEACGRRIGENVEMTTIGTVTGITYGGVTAGPTAHDTTAGTYTGTSMSSSVFGYLNYPHRITSTGYLKPTGTGWHPGRTVNDILAILELLRTNLQYGPFVVYNSTDWDQYLDGDYYALATSGMVAPTRTLRDRIRQIDGIQDVRRLDFLVPSAVHKALGTNPFTMIFVSMRSEVARAVVGMGITTVQWPAMGGMRQNYKVMCINVPNLRHDYNGRTGILQATWTANS